MLLSIPFIHISVLFHLQLASCSLMNATYDSNHSSLVIVVSLSVVGMSGSGFPVLVSGFNCQVRTINDDAIVNQTSGSESRRPATGET